MSLLILQRFNQVAVHGCFRWTDGGNKGSAQNYRNHEHHKRHRKDVIEIDSTEITRNGSQSVIEIDGTQTGAQDQTNHADTQRFDPYRPPDLRAQSTDCLHDTQFAFSIRDGHSERVHDAQNSYKNGDNKLVVCHGKPLIEQFQDPIAYLPVCENEQSLFSREFIDYSLAYGFNIEALCDVHTADIRGVVFPQSPVDIAIDEDRSLQVGIVPNDAYDRKLQHTRGRWQFDRLPHSGLEIRGERLRNEKSLALGRKPVHFVKRSLNGNAMYLARDLRCFDGKDHHRYVMVDDPRIAHQLNLIDPINAADDRAELFRKSEISS